MFCIVRKHLNSLNLHHKHSPREFGKQLGLEKNNNKIVNCQHIGSGGNIMASLVAYEHVFTEQNLKWIKYYRGKMNEKPLFSALQSFDVNKDPDTNTKQPGVYEIREGNRIIYIGGMASPCRISECLAAHFSGNDGGLSIGWYLTGPARTRWSDFYVRWMPCGRPREVAMYLLQDYELNHGSLPKYNLPLIDE